MSYDLVVWEGERPADDAAARTEFTDLSEQYMRGQHVTPTPQIKGYVEALVSRWPDLDPDDEDEDASPWSDGPLIDNASGPLFHFGMVLSKYQEASAFAADTARSSGLVCFDPQDGRLIS
ncbi:hypothetical protein AB0H77_27040 [Streptomyces sp. NPDC050844]|uniref:hypothetical protein n=1 Tax=Streptomyces sp. NPDC050844 TaxID=3155790 RepID=UPI0033FD877E